MLVKVFLGIGVAVGLFLIYVAIQPSHFEVSREVTINASAEKIFPFVNTRTVANSWNPFITKTKDLKLITEGPEVGVGSKTSWVDNKEMGTGTATVVESVPNERVTVKLEYTKPMTMSQTAAFLLKPAGAQTTVVWRVEGEKQFVNKLFCVFMNMDKMVGDVFAEGLGQLKTMVEAAP